MNGQNRTDRVARRGFLRRLSRVVAVLLVLGLPAVWVFRRPLFEGNFGVVDPGRVYRSAQPGENLRLLIDNCHLGSILNLRGGSDADPFYRNEHQTAEQAGVDFYDFPISATRRPSRRELLILIDVLGRCRYPLLIHCKSGADRTGLVTGLYLMLERGWSPARALSAFTLEYGHVPLLGPERLHEPFFEYDQWLKTNGLAHSPSRFRGWVEHEYRDDQPIPDPVPQLRPGPRAQVRRGAPNHGANPSSDTPSTSQTSAGSGDSDPSIVSTISEATSHSSGTSRR